MRPTWGPPGSCRPQMGPMNLAIRVLTAKLAPSTGDNGLYCLYSDFSFGYIQNCPRDTAGGKMIHIGAVNAWQGFNKDTDAQLFFRYYKCGVLFKMPSLFQILTVWCCVQKLLIISPPSPTSSCWNLQKIGGPGPLKCSNPSTIRDIG